MVLFPIALIWVAAVLYFIIRRSLNEPEEEDQGQEPRRFQRPPGPRPREDRGRSARTDRAGSRTRS
jgi:hypothetical protein